MAFDCNILIKYNIFAFEANLLFFAWKVTFWHYSLQGELPDWNQLQNQQSFYIGLVLRKPLINLVDLS